MFEEINAKFKINKREILFAWNDPIHGPTIYNPARIYPIPQPLIVHELLHISRQGSTVEQWWQKYIADPQFRLMEEIPAHVVEYGAWISTPGVARSQRRFILNQVAGRLSSDLYGGLITFAEAKRMIKNMEKESRGPDSRDIGF